MVSTNAMSGSRKKLVKTKEMPWHKQNIYYVPTVRTSRQGRVIIEFVVCKVLIKNHAKSKIVSKMHQNYI